MANPTLVVGIATSSIKRVARETLAPPQVRANFSCVPFLNPYALCPYKVHTCGGGALLLRTHGIASSLQFRRICLRFKSLPCLFPYFGSLIAIRFTAKLRYTEYRTCRDLLSWVSIKPVHDNKSKQSITASSLLCQPLLRLSRLTQTVYASSRLLLHSQ